MSPPAPISRCPGNAAWRRARPGHGARALTVAVVLAGCGGHQAVTVDAVHTGAATASAGFRAADETAPAAAPDTEWDRARRWWKRFNDPGLDALMEQVERSNLDLRVAWARLRQGRAVLAAAAGERWPEIEARLGARRARTAFFGNTFEFTQLDAIAAASYEIDVWGRLAAQERAAAAEMQAARSDLEALAMSLVAETCESWFMLREQRAQAALLERQIADAEAQLARLQARFEQGLAASVAVAQQRQVVLSLRAEPPLVEARARHLEHHLAVLAGVAPSARWVEASGASAARPPGVPRDLVPPAAGVPADLLEQRPDVRAARLRVVAADERVGAAIANRYPAFRIGAETGLGAQSFGELLDQWLWSLSANAVMTLFDGGRRAAEVERSRAVVEERLADLGRVYLGAVREVEDAVVAVRALAQHREAVEVEAAAARVLVEEAESRYVAGLEDYLPVVNASRGAQASERALLSLDRELAVAVVRVHRAIGGTWARELKPPPPTGDPDAAAKAGPALEPSTTAETVARTPSGDRAREAQ